MPYPYIVLQNLGKKIIKNYLISISKDHNKKDCDDNHGDDNDDYNTTKTSRVEETIFTTPSTTN